MRSRVFRLFACCVPVRGARRSTLCDLQRGTYRFIPNGLYEILTVNRDQNVDEVKEAYDHKFDDEIEEYFEFLVSKEFGFWCDDPESFPDLDLTWDVPNAITNAIIDVGTASRHDFAALFSQLDDLGCQALQIRFFRPSPLHELRSVLRHSQYGRLRSIDLLVPYIEGWTLADLDQLCLENPRIARLLLHSAPRSIPQDKKTMVRVTSRRMTSGAHISWHAQAVDSASHCGEVHPVYFVTELELFAEAQTHNTCLNRKISVDEHGDIRNCPALPRSFGNVRDTSLSAALLHADFRELWSVNKDQVEVCKDCEFRYVCTDCRAFIREPKDRYSKPSKCTYDPYSAQWE